MNLLNNLDQQRVINQQQQEAIVKAKLLELDRIVNQLNNERGKLEEVYFN